MAYASHGGEGMTKEERFEKYKDLVHGCIHKYFGTRQSVDKQYYSFGIDYEDLAQIGHMRLWEILDGIDDDNSPSGYIYRGVWLAISNYMVRNGSLVRVPQGSERIINWISYNNKTENDSEYLDTISHEVETYRDVENKVFFEQISACLNKDDAQLLSYELKGMKHPQIAEKIGYSRQLVQKRSSSVIKKIREMVS